ncbi:hypothetical protein M9X92_011401 [Pyricularia oryzae]|nr:hypothetical protein M9X92_011401 [Pyricularia oryzae]
MSHDSSPRKRASPIDGDVASVLATPLRPVSPASITVGDEDDGDKINENGDQEGEVDAYTETNFSTVGLSGPPISWKRKAEYGDPLQSDLVLIPIYENDHWYLLVMYKSDIGDRAQKDRVVCFLDPLESTSRSYERTFTYWTWYLSDLGYQGAVHRKQITFPQQLNFVDCGVFSIAFAYQIAENRQRFVNAVESGTGLDWTIDAPKWRIYIRSELEPTYDDSSATLYYKPKNTREGNDNARIEVVSACHALKALPKASKQALPLATIASSVDAAVDPDLVMGHNMTMASVLAASSPLNHHHC